MRDLTEKTISEQTIYEGKVIDLKVKEVRLPDGKIGKREVLNHPGAVAIVACTKENKLVVVRQFRKALERTIVEIPAGKLEKGEEPLDSAKRELEEETGYTCEKITKISAFYTTPGFSNQIVHVYFTNELSKGTQQTDSDEFVDVMEITIDEALRMIETGEIIDAKTIYAVQYLQLNKG
ncbi:ADP-ribose pyrophosphatase [Lottiidibacillus patelloidae]|uniref:ADP-ribose pyrophosphatase n=1 Tax=Lottiidibacillus patelloidae TaxID=2670334 RepID=A0A263BZZ2_9BACI|nr:NUDIX hydrolase [Lottiidibacillus patelloidae]OZM58706.1 ADP-ribose pyrophosphatase [Lottiidibacillus patelloidae]